MTPRVLIVDDNKDNRVVLADALDDEQYVLSEARDGEEALAAVAAAPPDVILLDIMMPRMDGFECCRRLKADAKTREIPVILVTALGQDQDVIEGLNAGATDYIAKPFSNSVVRARVRAALRAKLANDQLVVLNGEIRQLAAGLEEKNERLAELALHDGLTGLPNRLLFRDRLSQAIRRARREDSYRFALLFLDFDRFKFVNDTLGHEVGDRLLVQISERLRTELRGVDSVSKAADGNLPSRLGGDEFVVLLDGIADVRDAEQVAERLQAALARPYDLDGREITSTVSIGILTSDQGYRNPDEMLRDADTAMYHAKEGGRARHVVFDKQMQEQLLLRVNLQRALGEAIDRGELVVGYEPLVNLEDGRLVGLEAVVTWPQPGGEPIPSSVFMPIAEETGLVVPLGREVLAEACRQCRGWHDRYSGCATLSITVNLSEKQLRHPQLLEIVRRTLDETGVEPGRVNFEIHERVFLEAFEELRPVMERLKGMGVVLSMDGCGEGHSVLTSLHRLPIDLLKVDRAVTGSVDERIEYAAIMQAVVTLAHNLGLKVAAEGIRSSGQLAQLQAFECDYGQGAYLADVLPAAGVDHLMQCGGSLARTA